MNELNYIPSSELTAMRDAEQKAHTVSLAKLAKRYDELTEIIPTMKVESKYAPEIIIRSEDGKTIIARHKADEAVIAEALPGLVQKFATDALCETLNAKRRRLSEAQSERSKVKRDIQNEREKWHKREFDLSRAIAEAGTRETKQSETQVDVQTHFAVGTAPRSMAETLRRAGDFDREAEVEPSAPSSARDAFLAKLN